MNGRPLTDAQIAAGLRAHLPSQAMAGLRDRITTQVAATPQARRLPWFLGLGDADPIVRRRAVLLVATVALLAAVSVAAVGAWLESQKRLDPTRITDVDAFVLEAHGRFTELPAFRIVVTEWLVEDTTYYYDGGGFLREEAASAVTLYAPNFMAQQRPLADSLVWVRTDSGQGPALSTVESRMWSGSPECAEHWVFIETVELIGRSTHHVRCTSTGGPEGELELTTEGHMWIDVETGLPLRASNPAFERDAAGSLVPAAPVVRDVIELQLGPQAAGLFVLDGFTMSPNEFACAAQGPCDIPGWSPGVDATRPPATPGPPGVTPPPAPDPDNPPADLDAFVAAVYAAYADSEPVDIIIHPDRTNGDGLDWWSRWRADGLGNYRSGSSLDPVDLSGASIVLYIGGHVYVRDPQPDGREWHDFGEQPDSQPVPFNLPTECGTRWVYHRDDLVLDRPAAHIACGLQEFWIDREWMFITRAFDPGAGVSEVATVTFGPQPADLFAVPPPATVWE